MTDWDYDGPPAPVPEGCGCLAVGPLAVLVLIGCVALHRFDPPQMLPLIHADYQRCIMVENGPIAPPEDGDDEKTENQPASPPPGADVTDYQ